LRGWNDQLRWQRLVPFQNLAQMLLDHLEEILNYCRTKVRFGLVEAINSNIKTLLRRGPWLQEPWLPAAQGPAHGRHKDRIHRSKESSLKCASCRILVKSKT
jgi:hypothetical protein